MPSIGDLANDIARSLYEWRVAVAIVSIGLAVAVLVIAQRLGWIAAARRHPGRTTGLLLAALVVGGPIAWYLGSPIFLRSTLVEPPPIVAAAEPSTRPSQAPSVVASATPTAPPSAAPTTTPEPIATPFTARSVTSGEFQGTDDFHFGRGTATIVEVEPGRFHLRLEDFSVRNGPDLFVYLSPSADGWTEDALELGRLKATDGSFGYDLPAGTDPSTFRSAIIWCKQFSHLFATAPFGS